MISSFEQARVRVIRRATYGLNTKALCTGVVAIEGPFDTALANGLATMVAAAQPGAEYEASREDGKRWVKSPRDLLKVAGDLRLIDAQLSVFEDGLNLTQPFRHGSADNEWMRVASNHLRALESLDSHPGLGVLERLGTLTFDDAIRVLWEDEVDDKLPFDPKDRLCTPDAMECPECWRNTLVTPTIDSFGMFGGEGYCLACGYARTYEDTIDDMTEWHMMGSD
jgi:hypothetical protein